MNSTPSDDRHRTARRERQSCVDAVVSSAARNKVVVSGPGTGKTYLFRKVLTDKNNTLTLTFVNALVEDLSLELFGLSEVRTLHAFARRQLAKATKKTVQIFPKLSAVIRKDAAVLLCKKINFDVLFNNNTDPDEQMEFYRRRKDHYK